MTDETVDRELGRLEGRMDAVERRVDGMEVRIESRLSGIELKIDKLAEAFSERTGERTASWKVLTVVGSVTTALIAGVAYVIDKAMAFLAIAPAPPNGLH